MGSFDVVVGSLECRHCGHVSPADYSTNMQVKISKSASLREYRVGSEVEDIGDLGVLGYFVVKKTDKDLCFSFIEEWDCPWCDRASNWARIEIADGVITSVQSVIIDASVVESCNYVSEMCIFDGWTVRDGKYEKLDQKPS